MTKTTLPIRMQSEQLEISPDYCRISTAAEIALGLKSGRVYRHARCECINLIESYPEGCYANCAYCGMARERPGVPEKNSFIRVAWHLYPTDRVVARIAELEKKGGVGRVCISQVQDPRGNDDLIHMIDDVRAAAPAVPISALVNATTLDEAWLLKIKQAGADIVGFGLDAASPEIFSQTRGKATKSPHGWDWHWRIILAARRIYGPMRVNCHIIVGLGETDRELVNLFLRLQNEQIAGYLFSFNPEPGSAMQSVPRQPLGRWRRVQLVKHLIENSGIGAEAIHFDANDQIIGLDLAKQTLDAAIDSGQAFRTNGCPNRNGELACNRPYGSYRPGEEFRDYPFVPTAADCALIRQQLALDL